MGNDAYFCSIAVGGDGLLQGNAGLHKGSVLFFVAIKANALLFGVQSGPPKHCAFLCLCWRRLWEDFRWT